LKEKEQRREHTVHEPKGGMAKGRNGPWHRCGASSMIATALRAGGLGAPPRTHPRWWLQNGTPDAGVHLAGGPLPDGGLG